MSSVRLFSTGGTIAKKYDEISGELVFDGEHIQKILTQGRCTLDVKITPLMLKDSLDMNEVDRDTILNACKDNLDSTILITHGTDTMVESAKKLSSIKEKTIVLTGAMIPYAFKNSDAVFNLAFALSTVQTLPHGIYISMNGQNFRWDNVQKNKKEGTFEKLI
jgi:L-asparaginase